MRKINYLTTAAAVCLFFFPHPGGAQQLSTDYNQNGKLIKVISTVCPASEVVHFRAPSISDGSLVTITSVVEGLVERGGQLCMEQNVYLRLQTTGYGLITTGTESETRTTELSSHLLLFSVGIDNVLAPGALPEGGFVPLRPGESYNVGIKVINFYDGEVSNVSGFSSVELDGPPEFTLGNGAQMAPLRVVGGQATVMLNVAANAAGKTCKLLVKDGDMGGPTLIRTDQLFLGAVRMDTATQPINNVNVPVHFWGAAQDPLAVMTFTQEHLDMVKVTGLRGESAVDRPELFVPPLPRNRFVPRYYIITADPSQATFSTTLTLYYSQAEFARSGLLTEDALQLYRFNGTRWELAGGQANPTDNSVTVQNVSAFSYWAFGDRTGAPMLLAPTLVFPQDGSTGISTSPILAWNSVNGATSYRLQVSLSSSFSTTTVDQSGTTSTSYTASGLLTNSTYYWRVNASNAEGTSPFSPVWSFTTSGPTSVQRIGNEVPTGYELSQNFPNPFNPRTTIEFSLPNDSEVRLTIFNAIGAEVQTLVRDKFVAGRYSVEWDAGNVPSGIYFYRLAAGSFVQTKKLVLLR